MSRHISCFYLKAFLMVAQCHNAAAQEHSYVPEGGFVPDGMTAIALAEAILKPIYGAEDIDKEKPLRAVLKDDVWIIKGTLPEGLMGGVSIIEISKKDARVLRVSHGK